MSTVTQHTAVRDSAKDQLHFNNKNMCANGQLVNGIYTETTAIQGHRPVLLDLTLIPATGPRPCKSKDLVTKPIKRVRWATPRASGGSFPALGLSKRCSHDLCTQLRFEKSTPEKQRWLDHARMSADWIDGMMGFPKGWSDYMFPLESTKHSFTEDTTVPRIIISNIPNSRRIKLLGNACVPQQCKLSFDELWKRTHTSRSMSLSQKTGKRRKIRNEHQ